MQDMQHQHLGTTGAGAISFFSAKFSHTLIGKELARNQKEMAYQKPPNISTAPQRQSSRQQPAAAAALPLPTRC